MGNYYIKNISKTSINSKFMGRQNILKPGQYTQCTEDELVSFQQSHKNKLKQYVSLFKKQGFYPILGILIAIIIAIINILFVK